MRSNGSKESYNQISNDHCTEHDLLDLGWEGQLTWTYWKYAGLSHGHASLVQIFASLDLDIHCRLLAAMVSSLFFCTVFLLSLSSDNSLIP